MVKGESQKRPQLAQPPLRIVPDSNIRCNVFVSPYDYVVKHVSDKATQPVFFH